MDESDVLSRNPEDVFHLPNENSFYRILFKKPKLGFSKYYSCRQAIHSLSINSMFLAMQASPARAFQT